MKPTTQPASGGATGSGQQCPLCNSRAELQVREECHHDDPGSTWFAYMECTNRACALRSREEIAWPEFKKKIKTEWTPNTKLSGGD
jgi:hypothetical protein